MHEWGLACELVRQAEGEARARRALAVCAVTARVGLLSGVAPELLARAYEAARQGTLLESTPLTVETEPITASCRSCGREGPLDEAELICPGCGGQDLRILGGDGIHLARIVIETE